MSALARLAYEAKKKPPIPQPPVGSKAAEWRMWNDYQQRAVGVWRRDRGNT